MDTADQLADLKVHLDRWPRVPRMPALSLVDTEYSACIASVKSPSVEDCTAMGSPFRETVCDAPVFGQPQRHLFLNTRAQHDSSRFAGPLKINPYRSADSKTPRG